MNESEFNKLAQAALDAITNAIDACELDCDVEHKGDGVLDITLENGTRVIVNRHSAAREIWVAAKSGGYHFRHDGSNWVNTRDGSELFISISDCLSEQSGRRIVLGPH